MGIATTIGLDIAKSVFQVHGVDAAGEVVIRRKLTRGRVLGFFENLPRCLVGIEACSSSHYWARELIARGHDVRLLPAQYVKPYLKRQKNDAADAEAICEAVTRPTMRFVPVKTPEQQSVMMLHRVRLMLNRQRTQLSNALRAHLSEFGIVAPIGRGGMLLAVINDENDPRVPADARLCLQMLEAQLMVVKAQIKRLAKAISKRDSIPHSKALDTASQVSGFGNFQHAHRSVGRSSSASQPGAECGLYLHLLGRLPSRTSGRETIRVSISKPLDELIKPSQYRYAHKLGRFRRRASDHVVDGHRPDSARAALDIACGAARVLQFMDITGLQPSKAHIEPGAEYLARLPGRDHGSAWYDPVAKHHVGADEPYAGSAASKERDAWARRHNWSLARPEWAGMYYPGSCELYLYADASKGYSLDGATPPRGPTTTVEYQC